MREALRQLRNIYRYYRVSKSTHTRNEVLNSIGLLIEWNPKMTMKLTDNKYHVPTLTAFTNTVTNFWEAQQKYLIDTYDCDDFAIWFKAWASGLGITSIGIVIDESGRHAYNVVVVADGNQLAALFWEPQTSNFINIGDTPLYRGEEGLILI